SGHAHAPMPDRERQDQSRDRRAEEITAKQHPVEEQCTGKGVYRSVRKETAGDEQGKWQRADKPVFKEQLSPSGVMYLGIIIAEKRLDRAGPQAEQSVARTGEDEVVEKIKR